VTVKRKDKTLSPIMPNAGIRAAYRKRLLALIDEMGRSYAYWLKAAYRANPPEMAMDATSREREMKRRTRQRVQAHKSRRRGQLSSISLEDALKALSKRWKRNFDVAAEELAEYFATRIEHRSSAALRQILKNGGWTVEFKMPTSLRDVMTAVIAENVSLIKSIPAQFHTQVEGIVMRSVVVGHDLSTMTRGLQAQFGVTRRRAEFIARDQSSKATAAIVRARYVDLGIEEAIWMHSAAGKTKRPTHVKNSGKKFDIAKGWYDPDPKVGRFIQPGELINCRCVCRPVVKGFS
jgi:SPP1 gp7 family putative phage head morphogenesis protein